MDKYEVSAKEVSEFLNVKSNVKGYYLDNKFGTVGAIQKVVNHNNKDWGSDFVCLKTCYGFDK